jgi:hypothetical protein
MSKKKPFYLATYSGPAGSYAALEDYDGGGYRIAGPKAWYGAHETHRWALNENSLKDIIKEAKSALKTLQRRRRRETKQSRQAKEKSEVE